MSKILIVSCSTRPFFNNGQSKVIDILSKRLLSLNHEVAMCTFIPFNTQNYQNNYNGIDYYYIKPDTKNLILDFAKVHMSLSGYINHNHLDQFKKIINTYKPDIVNFHSIEGLGVNLVEYSVLQKIFTVVNVHDYYWISPHQFLLKANNNLYNDDEMSYEKWSIALGIWEDYIFEQTGKDITRFFEEKFEYTKSILNKANVVICPSSDIQSVYIKNGIKKIHVIPNPTADETLNNIQKKLEKNKQSKNEKCLVFGHLGGSDTIGKGVDIAIEAIKKIDKKYARLEIWGAYDEKTLLKETLNGLLVFYKSPILTIKSLYTFFKFYKDLISKIIKIPQFSYWPKFCNPAKVLSRFDYLIVSSRYRESYSLAASEAILNHIPVIASDKGGQTDFVIENVTGHLFKHGDSESLYSVIKRIIESNGNIHYNFDDKKNIINGETFVNRYLDLIHQVKSNKIS